MHNRMVSFSSRYRVSIQSAGMLQQLQSRGLSYNELMPGGLLNEANEQEPSSSHEFVHFTYASGRISSKLEDEQEQLKVGPREDFLLDVAAQHRRGSKSGLGPGNPRSSERPRPIQRSNRTKRVSQEITNDIRQRRNGSRKSNHQRSVPEAEHSIQFSRSLRLWRSP